MSFRPFLRGSLKNSETTYIGHEGKTSGAIISWDSPGESFNVLSTASVGDFVVIAFSFSSDPDSVWSWGGMSFTPIYDGTGQNDPGYYVGYKTIESGDSDPYIVGVSTGDWQNLSIGALVFSGVNELKGSSQDLSASGGNNPNPPLLNARGKLFVATSHVRLSTASDGLITAGPSGYSSGVTVTEKSGAFGTSTGLFYKIEDSDSEDPGSFSVNASSSNEYFASTLAFQ